jgi:hypothetical protein
MNRFQLNFKKNVGATSEAIRKCSPKTVDEWREYYYSNVKTKEHIEELGRKLYIKISDIIQQELEDITEQDCINYIANLVIERTFDGYIREIKTIYGQLESLLDIKIHSAPDEWDRKYNVDYYIQIDKCYIGIQIKPVNQGIQLPEIFKEKNIQEKSHKLFFEKYGGRVFYIFSKNIDGKKEIVNKGVIEEIHQEIDRLSRTIFK